MSVSPPPAFSVYYFLAYKPHRPQTELPLLALLLPLTFKLRLTRRIKELGYWNLFDRRMRSALTVLEFSILLYWVPQLAAIRLESSPPVSGDWITTGPQETVSLTCAVGAGSQEQELAWLRNGALVQLDGNNRLGQSSLCISPVFKEDNRVTFTCQLRRDASANASVQLNVQFPPELSGNETVMAEEDSHVSLTCDSHANPEVKVTWQRDGVELALERRGYLLTQDERVAQLSIRKVERDVHQGEYTCVAHSPKFGQRMKSFQLIVTDKTMKFPLGPIIAGVAVIFFTLVLAFISRWKRFKQCCK
ncbi:hypothetical protein GJAV_G00139720 [Gymnothorax javanicus]|nr:hypothetical protein GJAV_G00139720 [Gymnothorax javanicus]